MRQDSLRRSAPHPPCNTARNKSTRSVETEENRQNKSHNTAISGSLCPLEKKISSGDTLYIPRGGLPNQPTHPPPRPAPHRRHHVRSPRPGAPGRRPPRRARQARPARRRRRPLFYKPLQALDRGEQELAFYTAFSAHPDVPPRIRDAFFPRFHGTRLLPTAASPGESHPHLILDDLLKGLAAPSVTDIKIGACTWPPRAPEPYVAKCLAKDRGSTSVLLGFRVSGVMVSDPSGAVWRPDRSELKGTDIPGVRRMLRRYV
uniref:Inositol polyphosphate multikinase n=1 Tax=Aegilops tauschii subsp. strangulata TaxID=200361 RepID=A0A453SR42_AEGTS